MRDISKAFSGVQALNGASLRVKAGEIHGLVGENGAGKSTIIKVLAGVYTAEAGNIEIDGNEIPEVTPRSVYDAGVRFIHQELYLVPHFTVAESVFMGQELSGRFGLDKKTMHSRATRFLKDALHTDIPGDVLIRDLGTAERKLVQVARALIDDNARLVVFDEPTAPLSAREVEQVFKAIRRLQERGITIIYVSHYLGEITDLCDRVTVFRNGKDVAVVEDIVPGSADVIIKHMVGRDIAALYPAKQHDLLTPSFEIRGLSDDRKFAPVNLVIRKGEILGLAGLVGSGREELIDTIYGLRKPKRGSISLDGAPVKFGSPSAAVEMGIVLVPRDRRRDGLVLSMTVADNVNLASLEEVAKGTMVIERLLAQRTQHLAEKLDIRPRNPNAISRFLSGGNQQKVVLARWLATGSKLFILDEPTVGVDIGAKVEIYQLIEDLAQNGASVLVSSSDPAELLGLCDRILVLFRGDVIADEPTDSLTLDNLIALTTGGLKLENGLEQAR